MSHWASKYICPSRWYRVNCLTELHQIVHSEGHPSPLSIVLTWRKSTPTSMHVDTTLKWDLGAFLIMTFRMHDSFLHDLATHCSQLLPLIARFMGPTWGPSGADRTQVGPMLAPWTFPSGTLCVRGTSTDNSISASVCWSKRDCGYTHHIDVIFECLHANITIFRN